MIQHDDAAIGRLVTGGPDGAVLEVKDLRTHFPARGGVVRAVDGVAFTLRRGERLGLVGESGSGKSMTALSIMRLLPPPGRVVAGDIRVNGRSVLGLGTRALRQLRGSEVAMIFQDPMSSLNPVHTVGDQLVEAIRLHQDVRRAAARRKAADLLGSVHIPRPASRLDDYPHHFSGGMRQRVMIAMALANDPDVLVADEPTTALDVTTQAQILDLIDQLCTAHGTAVLMITHDLGVVAELCERIVVLYGGKVMEQSPTEVVFAASAHPYTRGLLASRPGVGAGPDGMLQAIPGRPPDPRNLPTGCVFHDRCAHREQRCTVEEPHLRTIEPRHQAACHFAERVRDSESEVERATGR